MLSARAPYRRRLLVALLLTTGLLGAGLGKWIVDGNTPLFWITLATLVSVVARVAMTTPQGQNFLVGVGDGLAGARGRYRARVAAVRAQTDGTGVLETPNGTVVFYSDDRALLEVVVRAFAVAGQDGHPDGNDLVGSSRLNRVALDSTVCMAYRDVPSLAPFIWRRTVGGLRFEPPSGERLDVAPDQTFVIQPAERPSALTPTRRAALLKNLGNRTEQTLTPSRPLADEIVSPPALRRRRAGTLLASDESSNDADAENESTALLGSAREAHQSPGGVPPDSTPPEEIPGEPES